METERSRDDRLDEPPVGDDRLARLLWEHVNRLNSGEALDAARIREEHPDVAEQLIADLEMFEAFGAGFDSPPAIGTLGDYTLRRQIGRGGMGVVYEAWENSMNRAVALKVLPAGVAADSRTLSRFVREAQVAGNLRHANIVPVYGMGLKEKTPYFAMELVEGETVAQILARMKAANADERTAFGFPRDDVAYYSTLARCFADVADGLHHAHSRKVIHRDIKPSNVILDGEGRLRILDFGLARLEGQESITLSGDFVGTPAYMSPEQARARRIQVDHRTDVYSLGATLYETLTLAAPFRGKDHADTLSQIIERDPVAPRGINARVPKELETIVLKCLRKNAGDRYGTAEALAQDLRRFVRGDPIEARPQARWERLLRKAVRRRTPLAASLLILILTAAVTWLALVQARELERQREAAYEPKVRRAVELLELASLGRQAEAWEPLLIDPRRAVFARGHAGESGGSESPAALDSAEEAVRELREATTLLPGRPDAHYYLAKGLLILGNDDEASREVERALATDHGFVPGHFLQAAILGCRGDGQGSQALLAEAERLARGGWGEDWRETRESIAAIEEAIRLDPGLAYAHNNLGLVLFWAGRLEDSLEALEKAIHLDRAWSWPHLNRARVLERQGKHDDAIGAYRSACERIPRSSEAYRELAGLLRRQGKLVEACEVCEEGLDAFPRDSDLARELDALRATP